MTEKDPVEYSGLLEYFKAISPYLATLFLSCWGGTVQYLQRLRDGTKKFCWSELLKDLVVSSFAGILTHFFCEAANVEGAQQALLVAISGHMGTRAIASFESLRDRIFGAQSKDLTK